MLLPMVPQEQGFYVMGEDGRWERSADVPVRHFATSRYAVLLADLAYRTAAGELLLARKGLIFDGGSKPKLTWPLFGHPWGAFLAAYTIHDAECATVERLFAEGYLPLCEVQRIRKSADRHFRESMGWIQCEILKKSDSHWESLKNRWKFKAVRLHAWWTLKRKRNEQGEHDG
jgi:hypothetical protein